MNNSSYNNYNLPDADKARSIYKKKKNSGRFKNKKMIIIAVVLLLLAVLCIAGVSSVFKGSVGAYEGVCDELYERSLNDADVKLTDREKELDTEWEKTENIVVSKLDYAFENYSAGKLKYSEMTNVLNSFSQLKNAKELCSEKSALTKEIYDGRVAYSKAREDKVLGDMISALEGYSKVSEHDKLNYKKAVDEIIKIEKEYSEDIKLSVNSYLCRYEIEEAREYVRELIARVGETEFLSSELARINDYETFQTDVVKYSGPIEHVFTHCLIAFPELCYSSPSMTASLDEDCVTPYEFKKMFQALYEKDYILIDINSLVTEKDDGSVELSDIYVPHGKKPLIFSIDDVTYDSRKMHTGMVDKLIVDENGRVCTYTMHNDGTEVISYDNEIFPIIDNFVREHPDFTYRGARGTLCHTGFDGVFGYRTQSTPLEGENVDRESEIEEAKKVAAALKAEGWTFASHSYGHANMPSASLDYIKEDTDNWIEEVTAIIGETQVMVWPYGAHIREGESHDYLYESGFRIFCGVGVQPFLSYEPDGNSVFIDRKSLDGYALRNRRDKYLYLFDTEEVWDPLRPKEVTW